VHEPESSDAITGIFRKAERRKDVFDVSAVEKL
jgi:hypothetical protein